MAQYKNKTDQEQMVPGAGTWKPGETKESPIELDNPNFEKVSGGNMAPTPPVTPAAPKDQTEKKEGDK